MSAAFDESTCDVVVIGGGVNGTGVARDLSLRGLSVVLFEKNDLAFGASGNSSGMIHGGARYLTNYPDVTEQSCRDSGYIQQIAPHLLFRIPFLFPIPYEGVVGKVALHAVDAFFTFYDRYVPLKRGKKHAILTRKETLELEPGLRGPLAGAVTFDEWGIDGARLCNLNALDAREHGAAVHIHHEVFELLQGEGGRVEGVRARDALDGTLKEVRAKVVVNATGAWGPVTAALADGAALKLRPGKGIHVLFDRRISNYALTVRAVDGRTAFVMPWQNLSYVGTTDDDYYGDLDDVRATTDEVRYLVQAVAEVLPSVRDARIIGTTAGVRPTLPGWGGYEDKLSREHEVVDHGARDGVPALFSMIGGKLASYRIFAEEMSERVARELDVRERCTTHSSPLPGGDALVDVADLAERHGLPEPAARRLVYRHGTRAEAILDRIAGRPAEGRVVCSCEPVLEAEVRHVAEHEGARTVDDVARRTRLGLGACGGMRCAHACARLLADVHGDRPSVAHERAATFLARRYEGRAVGLDGAQVAQEELLASHLLLRGGLRAGGTS